jgi:hypothetical protein
MIKIKKHKMGDVFVATVLGRGRTCALLCCCSRYFERLMVDSGEAAALTRPHSGPMKAYKKGFGLSSLTYHNFSRIRIHGHDGSGLWVEKVLRKLSMDKYRKY